MSFIIVFLMLSLVPPVIAYTRGHRGMIWWLYALLVLPIALVHCFALRRDEIALAERRRFGGVATDG